MELIVFSKEENIFLELNGKNLFEELNFKTKSLLLEKAIKKLENDITVTAEHYKDSKNYYLYWCHTYSPHRHDGLSGTVLDYYLIELVKFAVLRNNIVSEVIFKSYVPHFLIKYLEGINTINFKIKLNKKEVFVNYLRKSAPIIHLLKYLLTLVFKDKKLNYFDFKNSILFFYATKATTRLKGLDRQFKGNKFIIDESLCALRELKNGKLYKISLFEIKHFIFALVKTISFQYSKQKSIKSLNSNLYLNYIKQQSFLQSYFVILRQEALRGFFKTHNNFKFIVTSTNFGDPLRRQMITISNKFNQKTINFACRPMYTSLRAEDNTIKSDFHDHQNNSSLPDFHLIFDKVSFKHLVRGGIDKKQIFHYDSTIIVNQKKHINDGILILFAHHDYNERIIKILNEFKSKGLTLSKVYYKEHPLVSLKIDQKKRLEGLALNAISMSKYLWNEISIENTVCFTSNSTSAIDAVSKGAGVLWLPFLSFHSIQFAPIMSLVGKTLDSKIEFFGVLKELEQNQNLKKKFISKCKIEYNESFNKDNEMLDFKENFVDDI